MMTQSVMTQAAGLFARASGSVTLKGKQTGNDFSLLIGSSMKTAQGKTAFEDAVTVKKASSQADTSKNSIKSDDNSPDDVQTKTVQTDKTVNADTTKGTNQKTSNAETDIADKVTDDDKADVTKDLTEDEQLMAQIQAMLQSVGQAVMDKLNLSPEEFNQLLEGQGMSLSDLLKPENLQQLILASNGKSDVLSFLTDENLADTMKQLLQTVEEIKQNNAVGLSADQIKALLEQAKDQAKAQNNSEDVASASQNQNIPETLKASVAQTDTKAETKGTDSNQDKSAEKTSAQTVTSKEASVTAPTGKEDSARQHGNGKSEKDMNTSDRFQTFVENLVKGSQNLQSNFSNEMTQVSKLRDIANQIIERIKISVSTSQTSMELSLNPESLGKVNLSVQSKDGVLTAHFVVQNQVSKEAIESQIQTLRDTLHQQGVKVEAIEVTVSANAFDQNNNQGSNQESQTKESHSGRKITLEDAMQMTELQEDDADLNELTGTSGNVINYTA